MEPWVVQVPEPPVGSVIDAHLEVSCKELANVQREINEHLLRACSATAFSQRMTSSVHVGQKRSYSDPDLERCAVRRGPLQWQG